MSHFDFYSGSYEGDHRVFLRSFCDALDFMSPEGRQSGFRGFAHRLDLYGPRREFAQFQWGAPHMPDLVHVRFSGWGTDRSAQVFRQLVPHHRVSRVDVADDFAGPGAFQQLRRVATRTARDFGVKRSRIVPGDAADGSTLYLGSRESVVFVRVYEKGKQVMREIGRGAAEVDGALLAADLRGHPIDTWARCEIEVKPKSHAKAELATVEPEQVWGCAEWAARLHRDLSGVSVPRVNVGSVYQADDLTRQTRALVSQYGNTLEQLHAQLGDWACVGKQLGDVLLEVRGTRRGH